MLILLQGILHALVVNAVEVIMSKGMVGMVGMAQVAADELR